MSRANVDAVRRGFQLLAAGDVDGLVALAHPDFEFRPAIAGTSEDAVYRGGSGLRQYVSDVGEGWERFDQTPERFIASGDDVVVIIRLDARGSGSGVELSERVAAVWTLKEGKPWRGMGYTDPADALEAVGVSE